MPVRLLFNLILASCLGLFWLMSSLFLERHTHQLAMDAVSAEAKLQMQASLAIRHHTQVNIQAFLERHAELDFQVFSVPAVAAKQTMALLYKQYPGYSYREAVLNPTNPDDLAKPWEKTVIDRYREKPQVPLEVEVLESEDGSSLNAVQPILVTSASCLLCHGQVHDAPKAMRESFPGLGGFGWKVGEVIGAQVVTIPKKDHLARFRSVQRSFDIALILVFGTLFIALNMLLDRFVLKPMQLTNVELSSMATTDALTGVANRRAFDRIFSRTVQRAREGQETLSVLLLDIDHFKRINDEFGHGVGDEVLTRFAWELSRKFRPSDLFARLGGEEFVAMLPGLAVAEALQRAEVLRDVCASLDFSLGRAITVSVGVAQWDGTETPEQLIERCDRALYRAKDQGRNQVQAA